MRIIVSAEEEKQQLLEASVSIAGADADHDLPMIQLLVSLSSKPELIEVVPADWRTPEVIALAKEIYAAYPGAEDHPWVEGGNSNKQTDALYEARKRLSKD